MNYVVAVSGGVDSVVLLDMLSKQNEHNLVVAHFDHGIRSDSDADARFVWELARKYHLPFEVRRKELGLGASEALAREHRYEFLRDIANKYAATIVTAHHADDLVETVAINLVRGTGWRGLAAMGDKTIKRPLLGVKKQQLYTYALKHELEFIEDETNHDHAYLRNKIRSKLVSLSPSKHRRILLLSAEQRILRHAIKSEALRHINHRDRYFFIMLPDSVALELLRIMTKDKLTTPQRRSLLRQIKVARAGTTYEAGAGFDVLITKTAFRINTEIA